MSAHPKPVQVAASPPPPWNDFIQDFMTLTEGAVSPDIFRKWTGIALVAGALERRVWIRAGVKITYANLYTLLVAPPGVGKYIVEEARALWTEVKEPGTAIPAFHVSPDNMTKAAMLDTLVKAKTTRLIPRGPTITYHSLLIAAEEFQVLLPDYDQEIIGALNSIWNNKPNHSESRRYGTVRELSIEYPQFNILAGVQPSYFVSTFPEEAWTTGFARRIIMVYAGEAPFKELFYIPPEVEGMRDLVLSRLAHLSQLYGEAKWTTEAVEHISNWHRQGQRPVPQHSKLTHYNRTRIIFAQKLSLISAVARTGALIIELVDVTRALAWLFEVEGLMPDVFREMVGKSDKTVIEELHNFMVQANAKEKGRGIRGEMVMRFLLTRVPTEKAEKIMSLCERADIIARVGGSPDLWVPRTLVAQEMD